MYLRIAFINIWNHQVKFTVTTKHELECNVLIKSFHLKCVYCHNSGSSNVKFTVRNNESGRKRIIMCNVQRSRESFHVIRIERYKNRHGHNKMFTQLLCTALKTVIVSDDFDNYSRNEALELFANSYHFLHFDCPIYFAICCLRYLPSTFTEYFDSIWNYRNGFNICSI